MNEKEKAELIAQAENIEAIKDFFKEWWTLTQLYETEAKTCTALMHMLNGTQISDDDKHLILELLDQHGMMIELIRPFYFDMKEGEV